MMGQIVTFYSYKGGVGRSMALANTAALLARWGYKTLMLDWDLEAPGLENFFKNYADLEEAAEREGVVDLLTSVTSQNVASDTPNWRRLLVRFRLRETKQPLHLITAGQQNDDYFRKLRDFDVGAFYLEKQGGYLIERLRHEWKEAYDFVLVDSRTGVTDIGGICTIQLPDLLVLFFTPTEQGLAGTLEIAKKATLARQDLPVDRLKLVPIPIASRFDVDKEFELSKEWLRKSSDSLSALYADWVPTTIKRLDLMELTKIPYKAYFSFGEKLAIMEESFVDPSGLTYAYLNLAAMIANNLQNIEQLRESRDEYVRIASRSEEEIITRIPILSDKTRVAIEEHQLWLESNGLSGRKANLSQENLEGVYFSDVNLAHAIFARANLRGANFSGADLSGADLSEANLQGANLFDSHSMKTSFARANLTNAVFQEASLYQANLQLSNLDGAMFFGANLCEANLAGANLSNAILTSANTRNADFTEANLADVTIGTDGFAGAVLEDAQNLSSSLSKSDQLDSIFRQSSMLSNLLAGFQVSCGYILWAIFNTTDAGLVSGSGQIKLPLIPINIPALTFFIVGPGLVLISQVFLRTSLKLFFSKAATQPAIFPNGTSLDEEISGWQLQNLLRRHFVPRRETGRVVWLRQFLAAILIWWLFPITASFFWLRFLPRHDWYGTSFHIIVVMLSMGFALWSHGETLRILRGDNFSAAAKTPWTPKGRTLWRRVLPPLRRLRPLLQLGFALFILFYLSLGAISPSTRVEPLSLSSIPRLTTLFTDTPDRSVPVLFALFRYRTYANLAGASLSRANLNGRDLRYANCDKAVLAEAQMVETDLTGASFVYANLNGIKLSNAVLTTADLEVADLRAANLSGARLFLADLRSNQNLTGANFTNANMFSTRLEGANLTDTVGLSIEQLRAADINENTKLPVGVTFEAIKALNERGNLPTPTPTPTPDDEATKRQISELVKKLFSDSERKDASDLLVALYPKNKTAVVNALVDSIVTKGISTYRINLYIVRTLGSIDPNWEGTPQQLKKVSDLQLTSDYKDPIFKYWLDKAVANYRNVSSESNEDRPTERSGGGPG